MTDAYRVVWTADELADELGRAHAEPAAARDAEFYADLSARAAVSSLYHVEKLREDLRPLVDAIDELMRQGATPKLPPAFGLLAKALGKGG